MMNKLRTTAPETKLSRASLAILFGGTLLLGACTSDEAEPNTEQQTTVVRTVVDGVSYRPDGTRAYDLQPPLPSGYGSKILVVDRCKPGIDAIETIHYYSADGGVTGGNSVMDANGACIDGRLTPEDFPQLVGKPAQPAPSAS